jgi:colanic acid/amylovoran biosynthesis glycosyltransferase
MTAAPLHVLFAGVKWPPETFLARLIRGLSGRGLRITVATWGRPDAAWRNMPNVDFIHAPSWSGSIGGRLLRLGDQASRAVLRGPVAAGRALATARAAADPMRATERAYRWLPFAGRHWDVIYFPWNATAITYWPLLEQAPAVISCRGAQINVSPHNPDRAALRDGLRDSFARAAAVHCVSEAIRDEATHYGLDPAKAVVIRPAVDAELFCPPVARDVYPASSAASARDKNSAPHAPLRVVTTGAIIWRKGYEYALMGVRQLIDRGAPVQFDIIGVGDEMQRLLFTIQDLGLDEQVHWHGRLPSADVVNRLRQADVFLLSSLSEGIANAVLEAMACGLPVVTTSAGGMGEAVRDGVEGFLVPPYDAPAIADALDCLWRAPALRARMGAAGRARVERDFRLEDQVTAFADLFRRIA